ncbi:MAG: hypothetical protein QOD01_2876 [Actinomycetota bacterium]|nr:hypothetical protein [Actinomycetota bacterium]
MGSHRDRTPPTADPAGGRSRARCEQCGLVRAPSDQITLQDTTLGTLVTVVLKINNDTGGLTVTVLIPRIIGAGRNKPVIFATMAIKTASRGFIATPGPSLTYTIVPLVGVASVVIIPPLAQQADGQ